MKMPEPFKKQRSQLLWFSYKHPITGKWTHKSTGTGAEPEARRFIAAFMAEVAAIVDTGKVGDLGPLTVARYMELWLKDREKRGKASTPDDRQRLETYVEPRLGALLLTEVTPLRIRDFVRELRANSGRAARTQIHVYRTLKQMFKSAKIEGLVTSNPCELEHGELPAKRDADPEWRSQATYTVHEVERLISDVKIPVERRVQYALKAIAGLRHGEMAALCWRHLDYTAEPLARINVVQAWDSRAKKIKSTKSGDTRAVPMHPTLAAILASWKLEHWERIYGRAPTPDDHVVPTRNFTCVVGSVACAAMKLDLAHLKLREKAGRKRYRQGHDLRSWYISRLVEDGADSVVMRRTTHASSGDVVQGYQRFSWAATCREGSKLNVSVIDGKVLELGTAASTDERRARNRWRKVVTSTGFEPVLPT